MMSHITKYSIAVFLFLLLAIGFGGCRAIPENAPVKKNDRLCGVTSGLFRDRWWNYYERGISFSDCQLWEEAGSDFRKALTKEDADHRRVRTYGRHLIDYFPRRELGVSLFHRGRYQESMAELELSLSTEKSAKAEYYLDKARQKWIEQERLDTKPPEIFLESPEEESLSNQLIVTVSGVAADDRYVKEILVNREPVRIDLAAPRISFRKQTRIRMGENSVVVEVRDLTGKMTRTERKIFCDRSGPTLNIDGLISEKDSDGMYRLRGYAHDDSGILAIRVNGLNILKDSHREVVLNHPISFSPGQKRVVLLAEDRAGNRTRAEIFPTAREQSDARPYASENLFASLELSATDQKGVVTQEKRAEACNTGEYYALIIGINEYDQWRPLKNAVNDATGLKDILIRRYGFSARNIVFRTDKAATRKTLIRDFRCMAGGLEKTDNLLIYFSGHGHLDTINGDGYWIPVDGKIKDATTWITNSVIQNILCSPDVRGKNIMLISDSCYSGTLLRGNPRPAFNYKPKPPHGGSNSKGVKRPNRKNASRACKRSRQVIAAGGVEPVYDVGERYGVFARYFLKALEKNNRPSIDIEYLFHDDNIWKSIADESGQRPEIGRFMTNMDEEGQFVLILKPDARKGGGSLPDTVPCDRDIRLPEFPPPLISMRNKDWTEKRTVFIEQAILELKVSSNIGIQKVRIDNQPILTRPGRKLYLNYLTDLDEGKNSFLIECFDQAGNRSEKKIEIFRKIPKVYESGSRMSVLLLPFATNKMKRGDGTGNIHNVAGVLMSHLMDSKRFNMKETLNLNLPKDEDEALDLARKKKAEFVLKSVIDGNADALQISASMIEVETSKPLTIQDVYGRIADEKIEKETSEDPTIQNEGTVAKSLEAKLCQGLVVKLRDALPLVEGRIAKISGEDKIIINLGKPDQIKVGMRLIFFEKGEPIRDSVTGEDLGADTEELGTGRIRAVSDKKSDTELVDPDALTNLKVGHQFVMK